LWPAFPLRWPEGAPGRQLFMSGEGDADAGVFVLE